MPETLQTLESLAFPTQVDREVLQEWFDRHNDIRPSFVERNEIRGNKSYQLDHIEGKKYSLKIAKDIKNKELPSVIFRINQLTFGDEMPEYASSKELGRKIIFVIDRLLEQDIKLKDHKKEISKYIRLYAQIFGKDAVNKISNKNERNEVLGKNEQKRFNKFKEKIKILEGTSNLLEALENEISKNVKQHLDEAVFEDGMLQFDKIQTMTQNEVKKLLDKKKTGEIKEEKLNTKDFYVRNFDKQEKLLREEIGIDELKQKLEQVRQEGKERTINKNEIKAADSILKHLYKYPWQGKNRYGASPKYIKENKEIHCVGYSLMGHKFLQELGIEHYSLTLPHHSALELRIGKEKYYFDATIHKSIHPFTYGRKIGLYKQIQLINKAGEYEDLHAISGDPEITLQSHMLHNLSTRFFKEGKTLLAIRMGEKAIEMNPRSTSTRTNLGNFFMYASLKAEEEGKQESTEQYRDKAIDIYNTIITTHQPSSELTHNLGYLLTKKGEFDNALAMFHKSLKINPYSSLTHNSMGKVFEKKGDLDSAEESYKKAIKAEKKEEDNYNDLGKLLIKKGLPHSGHLITFTYEVMTTAKNVSGSFGKEENKIIELVQKKGFWRLRRFLFSQIKKDKKAQAKEKEKSKE